MVHEWVCHIKGCVFHEHMAVQNGKYHVSKQDFWKRINHKTFWTHMCSHMGGVYKPNLGGILWGFPLFSIKRSHFVGEFLRIHSPNCSPTMYCDWGISIGVCVTMGEGPGFVARQAGTMTWIKCWTVDFQWFFHMNEGMNIQTTSFFVVKPTCGIRLLMGDTRSAQRPNI